jgi:Zn-dependent protease/CBS domain-containing protein
MNRRGGTIPLGRIFGVEVGLDLSWFLIFALLTWSLSTTYYPDRFANWSSTLYWSMGALTAILLFVSVLLHEFGHALAAMAFKIPVHRIRLMIFGGVAELGDDAPNAGGEFIVAIAGPVVSLLLAGSLAGAWFTIRYANAPGAVVGVLGYLAFINLTLALFNLIPGFPLDGGRVLRAVLWGATGSMRRATNIAVQIGRIVGFIFIGLGLVQIVLGGLANGLWTAFIGMFLQGAARSELQVQRIRDMLDGETVSRLISRNYSLIPAEVTIQQLAGAPVLGGLARTLAVTQDERVVGMVNTRDFRRVPRDNWPQTPLGEVMTPLDRSEAVGPDTALWTALRRMEAERTGQLPVIAEDQLLGFVRRDDVLMFLQSIRQIGPGWVAS